MLVLSRKRNEVIVIGDEIEITVLEVQGSTVKLGLSAPRHVPIRRGELLAAPSAPTFADAAMAPTMIVEAAFS